jgi:hypothetical protein
MNRRSTIKGILTVSLLGISSFSGYKWLDLHRDVEPRSILQFKGLIAELAETIIPSTDTPGAKATGVENYIINVLVDCTDKVGQNMFLNGLYDVENYAVRNFNKSFLRCNLDERNRILMHFEGKDTFKLVILKKINHKLLGEPFFTKLKRLTVEGFCYSEVGATQGLAYDYIPGSYEPCMALKPNQKSWATK